MNKKVATQYFNTGKYLDKIYCFWNNSINRSVFVNDILHLFLKGEMANYELDKTSVSKLTAHTYDLKKKIKKCIEESDTSIAKNFAICVRNSISCSLDILASSINEELQKTPERESISVKRLLNYYENNKYELFLFLAFKHAASMPNQPFREKAKTGRKPRGSFHSVFYLSEEEKREERQRLITKIFNSSDRLTRQDFDEMIELMAYTSLDFEEERKIKIALRFLKNWEGNVTKMYRTYDFLTVMEMARKSYGKEISYKFSNWEKSVIEAEAILIISPFETAYKKAMRQNCFSDLCHKLDAITRNDDVLKSDSLKESLIKGEFFLPDFAGHITHSLWSYCLAMAKLSKRIGLSDRFCQRLVAIYNASSKNNTITDRINVLSQISKGEKIA